MPKISICIPAYKRVAYLDRLLKSIAQQTYKDFEVIVSDDSPGDEVLNLCHQYSQSFVLSYTKNESALGTPENWNAAIRRARGEWIKLMHDDDWFSSPQSLQTYAARAKEGKKFICSAYNNVFEENQEVVRMHVPLSWRKRIIHEPLTLLSNNVIGPPSVTMVHSSIKETYDNRMKWRVDLDFYIRLLKAEKEYAYIDEALVNVGMSASQVTNYCINQPDVELPEGLLLLKKYGVQPLKDIRVYDAWWRILRNLNIRDPKQLQPYTPAGEWPAVIIQMIRHQSTKSPERLRKGILSKYFMTLSFLKNQKYLEQ